MLEESVGHDLVNVTMLIVVDSIVPHKVLKLEQQIGPENLCWLVDQDLFQLARWQSFGSRQEKWLPLLQMFQPASGKSSLG